MHKTQYDRIHISYTLCYQRKVRCRKVKEYMELVINLKMALIQSWWLRNH